MQVLLFEMTPRDGHEDHYFSHVDRLRPLLAEHEGLSYIERFKSLSNPKVILSHSLWRDEAAIAKWRTDPRHQTSQLAGRNQHFSDYRIRISHALEIDNRNGEPDTWSHEGSYRANDEMHERLVVITTSKETPYEGTDLADKCETFASVTNEGTYLTIESTSSSDDASRLADGAKQHAHVTRVITCSVSRDYGMYEREEAPQYYKPVA